MLRDAKHPGFGGTGIGGGERDQWLMCMRQAMEDVGIEPELRKELEAAFYKTADFMRNKEG